MFNQDEVIEFLDEKIMQSRTLLDGRTIDNDLKKVTAFHYKRAVNILRGIRSLAKYGPALEISVLLRSLFNLRINFGWILHDDVADRLERHLDFIPIYQKKYFDHFAENREQSYEHFSEEKYQEINERYEEIVEKYDLNSYRDLNNWSGESIYSMADQINASDEYTALYSTASDVEHSNPNISHLYVYIDEDQNLKTSIQDVRLIVSLIFLGLHYFLVVKHLASTQFEDIDSDQIANELRSFKEYEQTIYAQLRRLNDQNA